MHVRFLLMLFTAINWWAFANIQQGVFLALFICSRHFLGIFRFSSIVVESMRKRITETIMQDQSAKNIRDAASGVGGGGGTSSSESLMLSSGLSFLCFFFLFASLSNLWYTATIWSSSLVQKECLRAYALIYQGFSRGYR